MPATMMLMWGCYSAVPAHMHGAHRRCCSALEETCLWCRAGPLKAVMGMGCHASHTFIPRGGHQMGQQPALSLAKQMFAALAITQAEGLYGVYVTPESLFLRCEGVSAVDTLNSIRDGSVAVGRAHLLPTRPSTDACQAFATTRTAAACMHMPDRRSRVHT